MWPRIPGVTERGGTTRALLHTLFPPGRSIPASLSFVTLGLPGPSPRRAEAARRPDFRPPNPKPGPLDLPGGSKSMPAPMPSGSQPPSGRNDEPARSRHQTDPLEPPPKLTFLPRPDVDIESPRLSTAPNARCRGRRGWSSAWAKRAKQPDRPLASPGRDELCYDPLPTPSPFGGHLRAARWANAHSGCPRC